MSSTDLVAIVLLLLIAAYGCGGGADFGAGIWDLLAGDKYRGARPRELVDYALAPVWEANNVWLVFVLVVTWTGFPPVFEAVMSTTWVALVIAALGLVLRGAAFAIRKPSVSVRRRRRLGVVFGVASVLTPYFLASATRWRCLRPRPAWQPAGGPDHVVAQPHFGAVRPGGADGGRIPRGGVPRLGCPPLRGAGPGDLLPPAFGRVGRAAGAHHGRRPDRGARRTPPDSTTD